MHHTPLKFTLTSQTKHTPTDIIVHLPFTFQSMHTQYWMFVYTVLILTSNLQTHTGPSRFSVVQVTCQGPFSSVSLAVVCVVCECATQGGCGGSCCDVVSPCRAWRGSAVETEMEKVRVQQSHLEIVLGIHISEWSCSPVLFLSFSFSLSLSLTLTDLTSLGSRCLLLNA